MWPFRKPATPIVEAQQAATGASDSALSDAELPVPGETLRAAQARREAIDNFGLALYHRAESMRRTRRAGDITDDLIRDAERELLTSRQAGFPRKAAAMVLVIIGSFSLAVPAAWVRTMAETNEWSLTSVEPLTLGAITVGVVFLGVAEYVRHHK